MQLNETSAQRDLADIFSRADSDGNEVITFDELYELVSGQPIDPLVEPFAREIPVLKAYQEAQGQDPKGQEPQGLEPQGQEPQCREPQGQEPHGQKPPGQGSQGRQHRPVTYFQY